MFILEISLLSQVPPIYQMGVYQIYKVAKIVGNKMKTRKIICE
jgi:hypothetical protein